MKSEYTVYIDESGDLGYQRGTQWFVMSATLVKKSDEPAIREQIKRLRERLNLNEIHMQELFNYYKSAFVVNTLDKLPFMTLHVITDTNTWRLESNSQAYNFICRLLLDNVSNYLKESGTFADVILSARGARRDKELVEYLRELHEEFDNRFLAINSKMACDWDLLQLADVNATSMWKAYEINQWGFTTPCFNNVLQHHFYSKDGVVDTYGITFVDRKMIPGKDYFEGHMLCKKF